MYNQLTIRLVFLDQHKVLNLSKIIDVDRLSLILPPRLFISSLHMNRKKIQGNFSNYFLCAQNHEFS